MISEVAMRKQQLETRQLAWPRMFTRAIKRSGTMQNTRAVIPVYRRVILAPERRTLPLTLYCARHKTDWPCETMSQHMINIYLCLPVRWKKDNLLLMHLCYYSYLSPSEMREQRRAGSSSSLLNMNAMKLSRIESPPSCFRIPAGFPLP